MTLHRLPPFSQDAEEAVIGSLLIDPDAIFKITFLSPADFFKDSNRWAFESCLALYQRNEAINQITVAQELARKDKLEAVGGTAALAHLVAIVPTSLSVEHYARVVKNLATCRHLIQLGGQIAGWGYEQKEDAVSLAFQSLLAVQQSRVGGLTPLSQATDKSLGAITRWLEGEISCSTGFKDLDKYTGGLQPQSLYIIGGYTSMGKTQLALAIARRVLKHGAVAFFSLEMSQVSLIKRLCQTLTGLSSYPWGYGAEDKEMFWDAYKVVSELPMYVDETGGLDTREALSRVLQLQAKENLALVVFDYIHLAGDKGESEERRVGNIVKGLKLLAKQTNLPVIAVAQFNRSITADYIPVMKHLKASGDIEYSADVILLLNHWGYYLARKELTVEQINRLDKYEANRLDCYIVKNKEGMVGKVKLYYNYAQWKIENWQGD